MLSLPEKHEPRHEKGLAGVAKHCLTLKKTSLERKNGRKRGHFRSR
jgi:hypothetical protein